MKLSKNPMTMINRVHWMWTEKNDISPDIYRIFRRKFICDPGEERVFLEISVCSTYELRINGVLLRGQQLSDYPDAPTGARFDVTDMIVPGENTVLLQTHYVGEDFLTGIAGRPFVKLAIFGEKNFRLGGDDSWEWCVDPRYHSGLVCKVTPQLGFAYEFRAITPLPESGWKKTVVADDAFAGVEIRERNVPQLRELEMTPAEVVQTGMLIRSGLGSTFAAACMNDAMIPVPLNEFCRGVDEAFRIDHYHRNFTLLPDGKKPLEIPSRLRPGCNGVYLILDTGREQAGYFAMQLSAPEGTVIDICHGEHLAAGRVSSQIENRNFTDRYVCRSGDNDFVYRHRRLGCRYIELHIFSSGDVTLKRCGLIPLELPLPRKADFSCEDRIVVKNRELAVRTLHLCMHEHYEDCPWREQALYGCDSRNQMLYGYYVWGNYDFAEVSIDLLGRSFDGERYFTLAAPGRQNSRTIPAFTLIWVTEILEHRLFSGSSAPFERWQEQIDRILDAALAEKVPGDEDFYHPGTGKHIWNFCEWNDRLSDVNEHPSSTYNVYLYEALTAAAKLHGLSGNTPRAERLGQAAEKLGEALKKRFWSDSLAVFLLSSNDGSREEYEHVQAIFLANGLDGGHRKELTRSLMRGSLKTISFSGLPYLIQALRNSDREGRLFLYDRLDRLFTPMLLAGATSLWEIPEGSTGFNRAGSLCHAWSSVMPFYCGSSLLGVRPLEPGFARFEVKPFCGRLTHAAGEIPTPAGFIRVEWVLRDGAVDLELEHPEGLTPEICSFEEFPIRSVNGASPPGPV